MDETTQQNAALVEQAAAASQSIVQQAQSLTAIVAQYRLAGMLGRVATNAPRAAGREAA